MPIDIEAFEERAEVEGNETHAARILGFLAANDEQAFRRGEIAAGIDADPNAVSAVLSRLKRQGLVRHKPPYWTVTGGERSVTAADLSRRLDAWAGRLGVESEEGSLDGESNGPHTDGDETDAE